MAAITVLYNTNCQPAEKVMQFDGDKPTFFHKELFNFLKRNGIYIMPGLEKSFGGKQIVPFPEKEAPQADFQLFKKAFTEIYVPKELRGYEFKST